MNLKIETKDLTVEERRLLQKTVRRMDAKRKRDHMPRLLYKLKLE